MIYDFSNIIGLDGITNTYSNPIDANILQQVLSRHNLSNDTDALFLWQDDKTISSTLITPNFISLIDGEGTIYPYDFNGIEKIVFNEDPDDFGFKCISADDNINGYFSWGYLGLKDNLSTSNINNGHFIANEISTFINKWKYNNEYFNEIKGQLDKKRIFSEVQNLLIKLERDDTVLNRRDLVNHLNDKFPHLNLLESIGINRLLKEFFYSVSYSNSLRKSITVRFVNDEYTSYLFDPDKVSLESINFSLENEKPVFEELDKAFQIIDSTYEKIHNIDHIQDLQCIESELRNIKAEEVFSISGRSKVEEKYKEAVKVYENYKSLIDKYEIIKNNLFSMFSDFEQIRNSLKLIREDLMNTIIDIYGENFKKTNPEIFDFDSIKWMEFEEINQNLDLSYYNINNTCQTFFEAYETTYSNLGNFALDKLRKIGDSKYNHKKNLKNAALEVGISSIFSILETRENSNNTISQLNYEIQSMKKGFLNDSANIRMDVIRLLEIFKTLKEYFIPGTKLFITKLQFITQGELKSDFENILNISGIKELKEEKNRLTIESRDIDLFHIDTTKIIKNASERKNEYQSEINKIQVDYDYAINNEPIEPTYLINLLSIRIAKKIFLNMHKHWDVNTYNLRNNYSNLYTNYNIENYRLKTNEYRLKRFNVRQSEIQADLVSNKEKTQAILRNETVIKEVVSKNLVKYVELSKLVKQVLETKLDENLLSVSNSF